MDSKLISALQYALLTLEHIVNDCPECGEDAVLSVQGYNMACDAIHHIKSIMGAPSE